MTYSPAGYSLQNYLFLNFEVVLIFEVILIFNVDLVQITFINELQA